MSAFSQKVYEIVKKIPEGKVATYSQVAKILGNPKAARSVGNALHKNPNPKIIPCHRVVSRMGKVAKKFAKGGALKQVVLLKLEGIEFLTKYEVDLSKYQWTTKV